MSYILDALKKTEQERQRGSTPSLGSQPRKGPPRGPQRPTWLYLLVGVLLLNAGVLLWWLKPWRSGPVGKQPVAKMDKQERQKAMPAVSATVALKAGKTAGPVVSPAHSKSRVTMTPAVSGGRHYFRRPQVPEPGSRSELTAKGRRWAPGEQERPGQGGGRAGLVATERRRPAKSAAATPRRRPAVPVEAGSSVSLPAGDRDVNGAPVSAKAGRTSAGDLLGSAALAQAVVTPETAAKKKGGTVRATAAGRQATVDSGIGKNVTVIGNVVLDYEQLPLSLRKQLPPLVISLHLYADNPVRRMADIDGHMWHEKDQIAKNLVIDEITPDGVIFNYEGRRFLKKVFR